MPESTKAKLDRDYYLQMVQARGLNAAITALQSEMQAIEHESFEGPMGYQPELWESIKEYREFSQELWAMRDMGEAMGSE